jgi:hypothetical protein
MHLAAAIKYLESHALPVDVASFDKECGVGATLLHIIVGEFLI